MIAPLDERGDWTLRPEPEVVNNQQRRQFEIPNGEHIARLTYRQRDGVLELIHAEVPRVLEGQGFAKRLTVAALEYAATQSLLVKPTCPFVQSFLRRHPEYEKLTGRRDD